MAAVGVAVLAASGGAASATAVAAAGNPVALPDAGAVESVVNLDVADPAAAAALAGPLDRFEGRTVVVHGITVESSADRRARDLEMLRDDAPIAPQLCPELPSGPRSTDGATRAYLGCHPQVGTQRLGASIPGAPSTSLPAAFNQVLASALGGGLPTTSVHITGRDVVVDVPEETAKRASALPVADAAALNTALVFTAHTNGAVGSITFTVLGDCVRYAMAVGGDACATTTLPVTVEQDDQ